ncbi:MAG: ABC transporter substrate-binding protein [Microbacteriaceae bacterium]|nr:ABC transporter substrate-binding protein [Microbacteriaceae bacterium]
MAEHSKRRIAAVAALASGALILSGCAGGLGGGGGATESPGGADGEPIKIGYVTPQSGPLAAFGEADAYVIDAMTAFFAEHPVTLADGTTHPIEIISKDTQSDSKTAADVASELILQDEVAMILVSSTPDTTNPVSDTCEANQVLCISSVAPWQAYYFGRGGTPEQGFDYTYHFFWGLEDAEAVYNEIWQATAPADSPVGLLLPNDPDGNAWRDAATGFPPFITGEGRTPVDPGPYENGSADFSAQIDAFKNANANIVVGVPIPPDFTTFWTQAAQKGFHPTTATIAKAILFPSAVEALPEGLGQNLSTEVWWHPTAPFASSLTGESAQELADAFEDATGAQWTQPLGFAEALFEVAAAVLEQSPSLSSDDLAATVAGLQLDTVVGPVDWTSGPVPNVAKTPLVGGQWRSNDAGGYDLVVVANQNAPEIPTGGTPEPIQW